MQNAPIYLIGPRGSGKTTIGQMLARDLGRSFIDLDAYLHAKTGHSVAEIVAAAGWPEFRRIESLCLAEASQPNHVIATGGGIILSAANRDFLRKNGFVVWLDASPCAIAQRLAGDPQPAQRPALTGLDPIAEIKQIMQEREPLYKSCCHCQLDASGSAQAICAAIRKELPTS